MEVRRLSAQVWRAGYLALVALVTGVTTASAQAYLVNTGAGGTSSIGAVSLFASGSTTCSPQPACSDHFQYLAARITLPEAATLTQIELWVVPFSFGGSMDVKIREEVNTLPSTSAPPLFSPNSIYSKRYDSLPSVFGSAGWVSFPDYDTVLAAGTYWITFEPVHGSNLNYSVPDGIASPLSKYAFYGDGNPGYLALNKSFGVRVTGEYFPGVAFGTATRVAAISSFFGCCSQSDDAVQEGTRDFTPVGTEGPALTSSYIFHFGHAHVHGRGILTENGLTAGAYSSTGQGVGAGRGIAFRTLLNLSDQTRTFRVNATLHGAFFNNGGLARAGVYVFDTDLFSSTILASTKTPGHFLLDADGLGALADPFENISPARLFPQGALLASAQETASFPIGQASSVPMQTGLLTVAPGEAVTVLFDVAVYAANGGSANFANTLSPAPMFLTDTAGNQVFDVVATGPSAAVPAAAASLSVSPETAQTIVGNANDITATVLDAGGQPVSDIDLTFAIASGPNAGAPVTVTTDANGEAVFTYVGVVPGVDSIQVSAGSLPAASATNTWVAGDVDSIAVTPTAATIPVGTSQGFSVGAFDAFSNSLGDVTADTLFTIAPDGSCTNTSCTASTPGVHTVTATYQGKTDTSTLTFSAVSGFTFTGFFGPIDNAPLVNTMKAGASVPVKFSLGGYYGLDIFAAGFPASQVMACEGGAVEVAVEQTASAGASGLTYDAATDQYAYIWKTDKSWARSCRQLTVKLSDGSTHVAAFKFK